MHYPLTISDHPLAAHKMTLLRDVGTDRPKARQLIYELGLVLSIEATRGLELTACSVPGFEGGEEQGRTLQRIIGIPILRSGLVLAEAFAAILPSARTGHLGIHHDYIDDEPAATYMVAVPDAPDLADFFIIDSLIGTGETMKLAANELRSLGIESRQIRVMVLSVHGQGLASFYADEANREIQIYALEHRADVDARGLPAFGFGNTADRVFGTGEH